MTSTNGTAGALEHLRILDLTGYLGQTCARMFGDMGADVILVEPPDGDATREIGPFAGDKTGPDRGLPWTAFNRNKRSVVLDLGTEAGRANAIGLVGTVDVVIEDADDDSLTDAGLGYESLRAANPGLVYVSMSAFGRTGAKHGYVGGELVTQAAGTLLYAHGDDEMDPAMAPADLLSQIACLHAAFGALVALRRRGRTGQGAHVDVSRQEVAIHSHSGHISRYSLTGDISRREGGASAFGGVNTYETGDGGLVNLSVYQASHFRNLAVDVMENHPILSDPLWHEMMFRQENREIVDEYIKEHLKTTGRDAFVERAQAMRVNAAPLLNVAEFIAHPHTVERGYMEDVESPELGPHKIAGPPVRMSGTPWRQRRPAPRVGEHTDEVLEEIERLRREPSVPNPDGQLPLAGMRILDFTRVFAGPIATLFLGFQGAEVIKVESEDLDENRGPAQPNFPDFNRNKLGVTINTRTEQGRDLVLKLAARSDAVIENFSPSVMDRLGLGYSALKAVKPDIVMVAMPGLGTTGPLKDYRTNGQQIMGAAGLTYLWGNPGSPLDHRIKIAFSDHVAAACGSMAIMAGLAHRDRTGEGQFIELSQLDSTAHLLGVPYMDYLINGRNPEATGNHSERLAPHEVYPCLGENTWCVIAVRSDDEWVRLVEAMGSPAWASDDRFSTMAGRVTGKGDLDSRIGEWTRTLTPKQVERVLQKQRIPACEVATSEDLMNDRHLRERGFIVETEHEVYGALEAPGPDFLLLGEPQPPIVSAPVVKGRDNDRVFRDLLGMSASDVQELETAGAIR